MVWYPYGFYQRNKSVDVDVVANSTPERIILRHNALEKTSKQTVMGIETLGEESQIHRARLHSFRLTIKLPCQNE